MLIVNLPIEDSVDKILKEYKKKLDKTKLIKNFSNHQSYMKPCLKRRVKILKAKYKLRYII